MEKTNQLLTQIKSIFSKMAEVANGYVMQSGVLLQDSSSYINGNCVNCTLINEKYQEVSMELKSLRLITNILHEEIKTLRNQQEDKEALREGTFSRCKKNKKASDVQCSSVVSEQVTWDFKRNQSSLNDKKENIENLKCDLIELIEIRSASRQHAKEVITSDIN
jgi:hypothetical protein